MTKKRNLKKKVRRTAKLFGMNYQAAHRAICSRPTLVLASGLAAVGCGDDATDGLGSTPSAGPMYVYGTEVFTPDSTTGFVGVVRSIDGRAADLSTAVEIPSGGTRLDIVPGTNSIVVRDRERLGISRFDVNADGTLAESGFVSFQGIGVTNVNGPNHTVDATRMIYLGFDGFLVEWNPIEMVIDSTVPFLGDPPNGAAVVAFHQVVESSDETLILFQTWLDETFEIEMGTDIVEYDLRSRTLTRTDRTTDCASFIGTTPREPAPDGFFYYATVANNAGKVLAFDDFPTRPCIRRRRAGASTFDPSFVRFLDEGGTVFGGLFQIDSDLVVTQELDQSLLTGEPDFNTLNEQPVWRWRSVDSLESFEVSDLALPPASAQFDSFTVNGRTYLHNWDSVSTRLIDLSTRSPEVVFQVTGYVRGFARLQ